MLGAASICILRAAGHTATSEPVTRTDSGIIDARLRRSALLPRRELPAYPFAQPAPQDPLLVGRREPGDLLGQIGQALPVAAREAREVGAPEHPLGAERVVNAADIGLELPERVLVRRVVRQAAHLDRDIGTLRQGEHA